MFLDQICSHLTSKMKFLILALAVACAQARPDRPRPAAPGQEAAILRRDFEITPEAYNFAYETSNGISAEEQGELKPGAYSEYPAISAKGSFSYTSPEGEQIQLSYVADENGFQPQGSYVPEIPDHIQRSLKYIADHPPPASQF